MVVTLGQQYNVAEKPTVVLYTYIVVEIAKYLGKVYATVGRSVAFFM